MRPLSSPCTTERETIKREVVERHGQLSESHCSPFIPPKSEGRQHSVTLPRFLILNIRTSEDANLLDLFDVRLAQLQRVWQAYIYQIAPLINSEPTNILWGSKETDTFIMTAAWKFTFQRWNKNKNNLILILPDRKKGGTGSRIK